MANMDKWFDGQVELVPPVGDGQLARVPAKRGVVMLQSADGEAILLLTAADIRGRLRNRLSQPDERPGRRRVDLRKITRWVRWRLAGWHFECDLRLLALAGRSFPGRVGDHVSWRPAWFIHADPAGPSPHVRRTREVFASPGRYVGPFPDARSAERFVDALRDAFDLCRNFSELRKAPNGRLCAYAQMNRCLRACDGSVSPAEYGAAVARAMAFAAARRADFAGALRARMKAAAGELQFERAAALKARLERLKDFDAPACRYVADAGEFRFVLIQPGFSRREARTFLVDRTNVADGPLLNYPLRKSELSRLLRAMGKSDPAPCEHDSQALYRMGLVAHYLFCSDRRKGLILRMRDDMSVDNLAGAIEDARELLKLREPKTAHNRRKGK